MSKKQLAFLLLLHFLMACGCSTLGEASSAEPLDGALAAEESIPLDFEEGLNHIDDVIDIVEEDLPITLLPASPRDEEDRREETRRGDWSAYVAIAPPGDPHQVDYVYLQNGSQTYCIQGLPMEHRPISALAWHGPDQLQFDRWSNPHFGIRYVFDLNRGHLIAARSFADNFYVQQQAEESRATQ